MEGQALLDFLVELADHSGCSARGVRSVLRVASTIARLDGRQKVEAPAIAEAFTYRPAE